MKIDRVNVLMSYVAMRYNKVSPSSLIIIINCNILIYLSFFLFILSSVNTAPAIDEFVLPQSSEISQDFSDVNGCYYNFQRYEEGDRIRTSEPCLNCTCSNRMLMCYLRVCPFTKAIGQDCTIEKMPDQCCPVITCPQVPVGVQLLTSSTTASPTTTQPTTELGFRDNYGCTMQDNKFYADGAQVPSDAKKPCELCYCIRNRTACVMQECTLHVDGCRPVYQAGICCPVRYECDYDNTIHLTTTHSVTGATQIKPTTSAAAQDCQFDQRIYSDGELIKTEKPCEHCYCMRGEIVCAVQDCGEPLRGKDCVATAPPPERCCPTSYACTNESYWETTSTFAAEPTTIYPQNEYQNTNNKLNDNASSDKPQTTDTQVNKVTTDAVPQWSTTAVDDDLPHTTWWGVLETSSQAILTEQPIDNASTASTTNNVEEKATSIKYDGDKITSNEIDEPISHETTTGQHDVSELEYSSGTSVFDSTEEYSTQGPSAIPGEGSCLVDGRTYSNASIIPSSNPCHSECICISSIPSCTLITCPPPPPHHKHCIPVQMRADTCCPAYFCDHDTIMPTLASDNHMMPSEQSDTTTISFNDLQYSTTAKETHNEQTKLPQDTTTVSVVENNAVTDTPADEPHGATATTIQSISIADSATNKEAGAQSELVSSTLDGQDKSTQVPCTDCLDFTTDQQSTSTSAIVQLNEETKDKKNSNRPNDSTTNHNIINSHENNEETTETIVINSQTSTNNFPNDKIDNEITDATTQAGSSPYENTATVTVTKTEIITVTSPIENTSINSANSITDYSTEKDETATYVDDVTTTSSPDNDKINTITEESNDVADVPTKANVQDENMDMEDGSKYTTEGAHLPLKDDVANQNEMIITTIDYHNTNEQETHHDDELTTPESIHYTNDYDHTETNKEASTSNVNEKEDNIVTTQSSNGNGNDDQTTFTYLDSTLSASSSEYNPFSPTSANSLNIPSANHVITSSDDVIQEVTDKQTESNTNVPISSSTQQTVTVDNNPTPSSTDYNIQTTTIDSDKSTEIPNKESANDKDGVTNSESILAHHISTENYLNQDTTISSEKIMDATEGNKATIPKESSDYPPTTLISNYIDNDDHTETGQVTHYPPYSSTDNGIVSQDHNIDVQTNDPSYSSTQVIHDNDVSTETTDFATLTSTNDYYLGNKENTKVPEGYYSSTISSSEASTSSELYNPSSSSTENQHYTIAESENTNEPLSNTLSEGEKEGHTDHRQTTINSENGEITTTSLYSPTENENDHSTSLPLEIVEDSGSQSDTTTQQSENDRVSGNSAQTTENGNSNNIDLEKVSTTSQDDIHTHSPHSEEGETTSFNHPPTIDSSSEDTTTIFLGQSTDNIDNQISNNAQTTPIPPVPLDVVTSSAENVFTGADTTYWQPVALTSTTDNNNQEASDTNVYETSSQSTTNSQVTYVADEDHYDTTPIIKTPDVVHIDDNEQTTQIDKETSNNITQTPDIIMNVNEEEDKSTTSESSASQSQSQSQSNPDDATTEIKIDQAISSTLTDDLTQSTKYEYPSSTEGETKPNVDVSETYTPDYQNEATTVNNESTSHENESDSVTGKVTSGYEELATVTNNVQKVPTYETVNPPKEEITTPTATATVGSNVDNRIKDDTTNTSNSNSLSTNAVTQNTHNQDIITTNNNVPSTDAYNNYSATYPTIAQSTWTYKPTESETTSESILPPEPPSSLPNGEGDYEEDEGPFGPGTCRYGGKIYVSAQQIPRDDPCDFCFCFRSDIICLQQSCPPPIRGCRQETIKGFCCPRYECPVSMGATLNLTTTTTTTTTTVPPYFAKGAHRGAARRTGCLIHGYFYSVGEDIAIASGPCLECACGSDGRMKCDPKSCSPEPLLRQMMAEAITSKR